jgi:hypothetical protein
VDHDRSLTPSDLSRVKARYFIFVNHPGFVTRLGAVPVVLCGVGQDRATSLVPCRAPCQNAISSPSSTVEPW